ncbi:uncharacterized protein LOC135942275 isoform X3 [Cloeon dipterum]|uniref:uncharacterized protein LOC135942275 isoform X3 n=1 Tax=Cloeon dipterum TaxID=197152 RepID=UPI00321F8797
MPRRKQGRRNFEEQEAANSLLQLAHKNVQPSNEGSAIEPLQVPNKRGRKPKVKKALPVLMRKSKKVYSNYQKCYTDKMPEIANSGQNAQIDDKLDWGKSFPGFNPDFHNRTPAQAVQICDSLSSDPDEGQSNQARIVKSSNSECWSSIVVSQSSKEDDDDVKSTCSNESTISANSDSVSLSATPLQSCSFDSLPRNWLPLKKRRLLVEEPESMLTKEWQPPSPESLQGSPLLGSLSCTETGETATSSKKMSILEQACISAGIEKFDDSSNDVQVMFEGVKSTSIPFYGVSHKRQRQMAYQPGRGAQFTPTAMPPIARPVAVRPAVYPDPAMCRPYNLSKPTVQLSDQQPLNLCSKSEALRLLNMDFMRNSAAPCNKSWFRSFSHLPNCKLPTAQVSGVLSNSVGQLAHAAQMQRLRDSTVSLSRPLPTLHGVNLCADPQGALRDQVFALPQPLPLTGTNQIRVPALSGHPSAFTAGWHEAAQPLAHPTCHRRSVFQQRWHGDSAKPVSWQRHFYSH